MGGLKVYLLTQQNADQKTSLESTSWVTVIDSEVSIQHIIKVLDSPSH